MKEQLLIVGAGNVGGYLSYNITEFGAYDVIGFLDDDVSKQGKELYGRKVLGSVEDVSRYKDHKDLKVVIGISSPAHRAAIVERLAAFNLTFPNFIAKNVWLSKQVQIGKGVILYPGVSINYETIIGDFVIMNMNCAIGHNCTLESFSTLAPGVNLAGFTYVERNVSMGIGSATKQNVRVGESSVIGGQSMLIKSIPAKSVVVGVPGRIR